MRNIFLSALFYLLGLGANAQASFGFANTATPGLADTVLMGSTVTYGVSVENTGNQPFSGNFMVYVAVLDSGSLLLNLIDSVSIQTPSLLAGDTSGVTISNDISPAKFMDGNNTVVIWPASPGYLTTDSIFRDIYVITFQETDELTINQLNIYPNPVSDYLMIQSKLEVEKVRILDLNGKEIFQSHATTFSINEITAGVYILEIITSEGKSLQKKLVISK
jgi:uncharacterized repeat protein (TIGR01451 family)